MAFEGATDDSFETTITFTEPTADRTHTLPDNTGTIMLEDTTDTSTNKTFTTPTITSGVFNHRCFWYCCVRRGCYGFSTLLIKLQLNKVLRH